MFRLLTVPAVSIGLVAGAVALSASGIAAAHAQDEIVVPHEFHAREAGSFVIKTTKELDSSQFQAMLTTACAIYGVDCSEEAAAIRKGAYYANQYTSSNNVSTSAWIDRHPGEEYYAKFAAPEGYTTCKAIIDVGHGSITGGSTFNGSIQRMPGPRNDGIGLYAVVPKNRPSGQWVSFVVWVDFVRVGTLGQHQCWPDRTTVFQCTGQNCSTHPGARM